MKTNKMLALYDDRKIIISNTLAVMNDIALLVEDDSKNKIVFIYTKILSELAVYIRSIPIALANHQLLCRTSICAYNYLKSHVLFVINNIKSFNLTDERVVKYWLLKVLVLVDLDDEQINKLFIEMSIHGSKIRKILLMYVVNGCNNITKKVASTIVNQFIYLIKYKFRILYKNSNHNNPYVYYKYFIIILKLLVLYGYNVLDEEYTSAYDKLWSFYALQTINDFICGKNHRAYKIYKLLHKIPEDTLWPHHVLFISIMNHHLYAPDGQGAQNAAEEFTELASDAI
jgi:hypothetical protein